MNELDPNDPLLSVMLQRATAIGPPRTPEVQMAGVPKPSAALWQIMNVASQRFPQFQELVKYLPLSNVTPAAKAPAPHIKALLDRGIGGIGKSPK